MAIQLATLNIQVREHCNTTEAILQLEQFLEDAAYEADAEQFEVFYEEKKGVVGISIPFDDHDPLDFLEAGAILGSCYEQYNNSDIKTGFIFWKSINTPHGVIVASPQQ